jgi:hypothetical protein
MFESVINLAGRRPRFSSASAIHVAKCDIAAMRMVLVPAFELHHGLRCGRGFLVRQVPCGR